MKEMKGRGTGGEIEGGKRKRRMEGGEMIDHEKRGGNPDFTRLRAST